MTHPKPDVTSSPPSPEAGGYDLLPCPFCGHAAEFGKIDDAEESENAGGEFIQCTNPRCEASSALIFGLKRDPRPLLAERWNQRIVAAAPSPPSPVPSSVSGEWQREFIAWADETWRGCEPDEFLAGTHVAVGHVRQLADMFRALAVPSPSPSGQYGELVKRLRAAADFLRTEMDDAETTGRDIAEAADAILALEAERDEACNMLARNAAAVGQALDDAETAEARCAELKKALEVLFDAFDAPFVDPVLAAQQRENARDLTSRVLASLPASPDQGNTRKDDPQ